MWRKVKRVVRKELLLLSPSDADHDQLLRLALIATFLGAASIGPMRRRAENAIIEEEGNQRQLDHRRGIDFPIDQEGNTKAGKVEVSQRATGIEMTIERVDVIEIGTEITTETRIVTEEEKEKEKEKGIERDAVAVLGEEMIATEETTEEASIEMTDEIETEIERRNVTANVNVIETGPGIETATTIESLLLKKEIGQGMVEKEMVEILIDIDPSVSPGGIDIHWIARTSHQSLDLVLMH